VAEAFIPNPESKPEVNHIGGNKADNRVEKLEWCTPAENCDHAARSGLLDACRGQRHGNAKLSELDVIDIRWLKGLGVTITALAREYQVSAANIGHIVTGRSWSHV
jgi:hypothetical protein